MKEPGILMKNQNDPVLRVGIISDVQGYNYAQDWGMHNLEKALNMLEKMDIDVSKININIAKQDSPISYGSICELISSK